MSEFAKGGPIRGKVQRLWFTPVGCEVLATEGGQLWYGDTAGLGSVADMSKYFTVMGFESSPIEDEPPCRHTVVEYDDHGRATCRLCGQPVSKEAKS